MNAETDRRFFEEADRILRGGSRLKPHYAGVVPIRRALTAARKSGIDVAGFEALPDGTIRVFDARLAPPPAAGEGAAPNPLDRLHDDPQHP